jgi:hypothetical protein
MPVILNQFLLLLHPTVRWPEPWRSPRPALLMRGRLEPYDISCYNTAHYWYEKAFMGRIANIGGFTGSSAEENGRGMGGCF